MLCSVSAKNYCLCSLQVVKHYERAVIFRLGRLRGGAQGPGFIFIIPCTDNIRKVDLRLLTFNVPPQEILTRDSVTVEVDAVVYYRVENPLKAIVCVNDYRKDVMLPRSMQRAMAAEAEATREARAKVISAEGELKAARSLKEASEVMADNPASLQVHLNVEAASSKTYHAERAPRGPSPCRCEWVGRGEGAEAEVAAAAHPPQPRQAARGRETLVLLALAPDAPRHELFADMAKEPAEAGKPHVPGVAGSARIQIDVEDEHGSYCFQILTRDSVTVAVDAVVFYRVQDPKKAVVCVSDYSEATRYLAATTLRNTMGIHSLSEILCSRETLARSMQIILDKATGAWGIIVERVEIKDVRLPSGLQRAMAAEAEAAREARAKVISAEGEMKAARTLMDASNILTDSPASLQLRYLQTLTTISTEQNYTIVFPLPMDLISAAMKK
ncbi:Band 7 protein AAEL010189 [Gryllus bimaculatus]|nr:Band 7 protein AAEL010189 [Gryllus bimaculatus]